MAFIFLFHNTQRLSMVKRLVFVFLSVLSACTARKDTLFRLVPATHSGLYFENTVEEKDSINILTVQYMYHGGGVAVGDFNNDGLEDVFFTGNMVPNRLYLNRGELKFEDVSKQAAIGGEGRWNTGVALADVNNDNLIDIYVCASIKEEPSDRTNMLFINKGLDENGIPVFMDEATRYGVADTGYSQNAAFLDYDKDGDLDLYVLTNLESDLIPSNYRPRILDGSALNNDKLYRNNGDNTFTDVTLEAGILIEGYGLGIAIADINDDGWPDIYIGNDYISNDILYINNRDGTFTNEIKDRLKHQSLFTMGVDIADINNDALPDIVTLDMLPENNLRRKTVSGGGATYVNYLYNREFGYEYQYMRNMLQINNGDGTFREVGQMAGIHQTEWSWSSLFMDVDNDGFRDLFITNGFPKDVTDKDYVMFKREVGIFNHHRSLIDSIPVLKVPNYAFQNNGDISFTDKTSEWGLYRPSFSMGAAFADLDNDGDLDYVVNNINDLAFLYENTLYAENKNHPDNNFLRVKLIPTKNTSAQGTKLTIRYGGNKTQFHEHSVYRGYLSTVEDIAHFGLGKATTIDSLVVEWPDGNVQNLFGIDANRVLTIEYAPSSGTIAKKRQSTKTKLVSEISAKSGLQYRHREWDKIDFYRQRTLPHKLSQTGPGIAVGDVNGDQLDDIVIGGSALYDAVLFLQKQDGTFTPSSIVKTTEKKSEDQGMLLFDADNDGDLDLYVVSGSYEFNPDDIRCQDRLYRNDGKGNFTLVTEALPAIRASGSCVRAADIDGDGDLDLFVGGRVVAGAYPMPAESCILRNEGGRFIDATLDVCAELKTAGMVTDAIWSDYDNDGKVDLIIVGEFMPVTFYKNTGTNFVKAQNTGADNHWGWWNSIVAHDFDKDGDTDYTIGNLGLNNYYNISNEHPLRVYAKDFDDNGSVDAILSCYFKSENGEILEYPAHFWDELYGQSPKFRGQFRNYKHYGTATMEMLLKPYDLTGMLVLTANYPYTSYLENNGDGSLTVKPLPREVQVAPINGMVVTDIDGDGNMDVLMTGNDYGNEVFTGRYDACTGVTLLGDGKGSFSYHASARSGFRVDGDGKALAKVNTSEHGPIIVATQNLDSVRVFARINNTVGRKIFSPLAVDKQADIIYSDGRKEKVEFYYGSGYLSQSTRAIELPQNVSSMVINDFFGHQRTVSFDNVTLSKKVK